MKFPKELFNPIDRHLAAFLAEKTGDTSEEFLAACLLTGAALSSGDSCLELSSTAGKNLSSVIERCPADLDLKLPSLKKWTALLKLNPAVGAAGGSPAPLILDNENRLYYYRYYHYEKIIADRIKKFTEARRPLPDTRRLKEILDLLFPSDKNSPGEEDMQRRAAYLACVSPLCVISGGPGTGKTSTVVKIIALLADAAQRSGKKFRAALTAPTGKAAARLKESVGSAIEGLRVSSEIKEAIPAETFTLHRLLGYVPGMDEPRYNSANPLPYDLIVADEFSMADLPMAARLFSAVAEGAGLILLGDRDQLSSVEAGAVFAGICAGAASGGSRASAPALASEAGITLPVNPSAPEGSDILTVLTKSWRFSDSGGIGAAAAAIREGRSSDLLKLMEGSDPTLTLINPDSRLHAMAEFTAPVREYFTEYFNSESPDGALDSMKKFIFLCPLRQGLFGAEMVNRACVKVLADKLHEGGQSLSGFYSGRPIMVTENDYGVHLFNGDTGLIVKGEGGLAALFRRSEGGIRQISTAMLPAHETVYAMTVHKSQGSEFDRVAIMLPDTSHRVLTRELLYTAFTRARSKVTIFGTREVLASAVENPTLRKSGLADMIRGA